MQTAEGGGQERMPEEVSLEGSPEGMVEGQPTGAEAEGPKHGDKKERSICRDQPVI